MRKQIRIVVMTKEGNYVAKVDIVTTESSVLARAVVEDHHPPLVYETERHLEERTALADVATWLRHRCSASFTCLASEGGAVVVITGDASLRVKSPPAAA